mgnify:CR=1 FL=1
MWTIQFSCYVFLYIITSATSETSTELTGKEIRLLDQIDNAQVLPSLIMNLEHVLNNYITDKICIERNALRVILWSELPSNNAFENYFKTNFKIIKYDETYRDLILKKYDYTREGTFQEGRTWVRFVYVPVPEGFLTLFFSYTVKPRNCWLWFWCSLEVSSSTLSNIENFINSASCRMYDKLLNPNKSIYGHGLSLVSSEGKTQYFFVHHDGDRGYIEQLIPSFTDGLAKQEQINKQKLSSCILIIANGQKSLHSIRHPHPPGHIIPDFHAYYIIDPKIKHSTPHGEL